MSTRPNYTGRMLRRSYPQPPLSDTSRAVVTVLLGIYLVGLVLTVAVNTTSGGSMLLSTIKARLFSPWMVPAWLDLGFDYRLTHGFDDDADHVLDVRRHDDPRGRERIRLPDGIAGERAARWRRLARAVAAPTDGTDRDALLPTAIARGLFDDAGASDVVLRVMRLPLPDRGTPAAEMQQAFSGRVRLVGDEVQFIRQEPRGEVAPVVPRPADPATIDNKPEAAP